jgi:biopolymer transport protein ExbD
MKIRRKDQEDVAIDMSPMIDMVFLLLIFFIVASAIVDEKPAIDVPSAAYAKVPEDIKGRFMVTVNKDGGLLVGLRGDPVTIDQVKEIVAKEVEGNSNLRVYIRADEDVEYRVSQELMTACAEVGAMDMIFAAYEE